jgi:uracil-DNA glycosylase
MDLIKEIPEEHRQILLMAGVDEILSKVKLTDYTFNAFKYTPYSKIKVVIVGETPYPTGATGLAFSADTVKGSLRNIYKCLLEHKLISRTPDHGNLKSWVEQGVLLLNKSLTRGRGDSKLWEPVIGQYLKILLEQKSNIVIMLWGKPAQELLRFIGAKTAAKHLVLTWGHPSPAAKNNQSTADVKNFIRCDNFTRANRYLRARGGAVNWDSVNLI